MTIAPGVIATEMWDRFAGEEMRDQVASMIPVARIGAAKRSPQLFFISVPTTRNSQPAHHSS